MTGETRRTLRRLIDQRRRALVADDRDVCVGCGADYAARTEGCKKCWDRWRSRNARIASVAA